MADINPSVIVQSTLALITAISFTDAVRDLIAAAHPKTLVYAAVLRMVSVILLVLVLVGILSLYPQEPHAPIAADPSEMMSDRIHY